MNYLRHLIPQPLRLWWRALPEHRQDRLAGLMPLLAIVLFVAAVFTSIAYLRAQEGQAGREALQRDAEYARQRLSMRLMQQQDALQRLARQLAADPAPADKFSPITESILSTHAETREIFWVDANDKLVARHGIDPVPATNAARAAVAALPASGAAANRQAIYTLVPQPDGTDPVLELAWPLYQGDVHQGYLVARLAVSILLYNGIPTEIYPRYAASLIDSRQTGKRATPATPQTPFWSMEWLLPGNSSMTVALSPLPENLALRMQTYRTASAMRSRVLIGLLLFLSILAAWLLLANWLHLRRRQRVQKSLQTETNFRRAMENSLVTGMRALDLEGRITHVNAAFCRMTGLREDELVGQMPPFSFWHPDDRERNARILQKTLEQDAPQGGHEMRVVRKDGSQFEARMYMSPLVGADGAQSGWMTSMNDVTEPNRFKRQLSSSYERFGRVLDAIEASVSVAPLGGKELLFANQGYRQWFGEDEAEGHVQMLALAGSVPLQTETHPAISKPGSNNVEILLPQTERWIEVRSRYLQWRDGQLAQLVVATDITQRREAEQRSAQHAQRAQASSRLVTMGEMASSVAHELNQPLTAIQNYCNGMRDRIARGGMAQEDLLAALEKTARQAQRAGQIIQRIREFVKRSAPNYALANVHDMVDAAVDLAGIDMRRRMVRLTHAVDTNVPALMGDRILIEQVLVNLMKNAAEAIDNAGLPRERRQVRLSVSNDVVADRPAVRFMICDTGTGLSEAALQHLFEAFFTTKAEGLGIGLNLCRSIVESHQGRLYAENLYNDDHTEVNGCCFSFWLPVQPLEPLEASASALSP
ncbi:MAG: PAS domain S-box protein [Brachymonas sp.]|nr:PAS domain S-box protein [Brachymonas sp.]